MYLTHSDPRSWAEDLQREIHRYFKRQTVEHEPERCDSEARPGWSPSVDIMDAADKFMIIADLPGVDPQDIEIAMENNVLTMKGSRPLAPVEKEAEYTRIERFSGSF
jgi:HSP20 family protein